MESELSTILTIYGTRYVQTSYRASVVNIRTFAEVYSQQGMADTGPSADQVSNYELP